MIETRARYLTSNPLIEYHKTGEGLNFKCFLRLLCRIEFIFSYFRKLGKQVSRR